MRRFQPLQAPIVEESSALLGDRRGKPKAALCIFSNKGGANMTTFGVPTVTTARLRLRAFRASDLDAYSAMQANPEVMRYMVMGRIAMPAEVWRTMLMSLGSWALRGYGMWACEKIEGDVF